MREFDFDIKAFPLKHVTGKYGLHFARQAKLSDQHYFIQRICNQIPKFINYPHIILSSNKK